MWKKIPILEAPDVANGLNDLPSLSSFGMFKLFKWLSLVGSLMDWSLWHFEDPAHSSQSLDLQQVLRSCKWSTDLMMIILSVLLHFVCLNLTAGCFPDEILTTQVFSHFVFSSPLIDPFGHYCHVFVSSQARVKRPRKKPSSEPQLSSVGYLVPPVSENLIIVHPVSALQLKQLLVSILICE